MFKNTLLVLLFIVIASQPVVVAQQKNTELEKYGLKYDPKSPPGKSCYKCLVTLSQLPQDVHYGLKREGNDIYFVMNDKTCFNQLFDDKDDAIAVDVIQKKQFPCGKNNDYDKKDIIKGRLLQPLYLKSILKTALSVPGAEVIVKIAELPADIANSDELEFNLVIIKNDAICHYNQFYNLPGIQLDLLKMDLFMDTLANQGISKKGPAISLAKSIEFVIPFEKNKYEYKNEDLKPIRDTLNLSYYNIKSIRIRAYSSVEGSEEKNLELQKKRGESIIAALQSFQNLPITEDVVASENWVEFLLDISNTPFAPLKLLSKKDIKKELDKKSVSDQIEPLLKKERKAILFIDLEKKTQFSDLSETDAKKTFADALKQNKLDVAYDIQQAIFQNVETKKYSENIVGELEIPQEATYQSLLLNQLVFKSRHEENVLNALHAFERMDGLTPNVPLIRYNICVLETKLLKDGELIVRRGKVLADIEQLNKLKFDPRLVRRLKINYNMIVCNYYMYEKKYADKNNALNFINQNYKNINYKDEDLLRLAQYFVLYHKEDWALKVIEGRATKLDVSEDLLFFYINLTIVDPKNTAKESYRTILSNAYNVNRKRFCGLFGTAYSDEGGISFQILADLYLKKTFCENCQK